MDSKHLQAGMKQRELNAWFKSLSDSEKFIICKTYMGMNNQQKSSRYTNAWGYLNNQAKERIYKHCQVNHKPQQ